MKAVWIYCRFYVTELIKFAIKTFVVNMLSDGLNTADKI